MKYERLLNRIKKKIKRLAIVKLCLPWADASVREYGVRKFLSPMLTVCNGGREVVSSVYGDRLIWKQNHRFIPYLPCLL